MFTGYETREYPYPQVQLPSLALSGGGGGARGSDARGSGIGGGGGDSLERVDTCHMKYKLWSTSVTMIVKKQLSSIGFASS
jgi:hypothetical protein